MAMRRSALFLLFLAITGSMVGQIDPEKRRLIQGGYNQPLEGKGPIAGYAYFYYNEPGFYRTNLTLRVAIAPVYLDSELGFRDALGPNTDVAIGIAGGGFADSYSEVRGGRLLDSEGFTGHGGKTAASLYHRVNPGQRVPLTALVRGIFEYNTYDRDDDTAAAFKILDDRMTYHLRVGLRWGGQEPIMFPALAMEVSGWVESQFRDEAQLYGFAGDRMLESTSHRYWGRALLAYTMPEWQHRFAVNLTAGGIVDADRFSAYRLGGALPLIGEFPLMLPGYFYQEISAERFVLLSGQYSFPIAGSKRWAITSFASTALVDYVPGLDQPGNWHSGLGGGILYRSSNDAWKIMLGYSYGVDAIREDGRGANSIGILIQYDLEAADGFEPFWRSWLNPDTWRGFDRVFNFN